LAASKSGETRTGEIDPAAKQQETQNQSRVNKPKTDIRAADGALGREREANPGRRVLGQRLSWDKERNRKSSGKLGVRAAAKNLRRVLVRELRTGTWQSQIRRPDQTPMAGKSAYMRAKRKKLTGVLGSRAAIKYRARQRFGVHLPHETGKDRAENVLRELQVKPPTNTTRSGRFGPNGSPLDGKSERRSRGKLTTLWRAKKRRAGAETGPRAEISGFRSGPEQSRRRMSKKTTQKRKIFNENQERITQARARMREGAQI
jgi:hypothetical protein